MTRASTRRRRTALLHRTRFRRSRAVPVASPYRGLVPGPSPANWLPFMARRSAENRGLLTATRVSDRAVGEQAELAAYRKAWMRAPWMSGWNACARRNPLPANRPTTCANPSTASTESTRSRGRMRSEGASRTHRKRGPTSPKAGSALGALMPAGGCGRRRRRFGRGTHQSMRHSARDSRRRHVLRAGRSA